MYLRLRGWLALPHAHRWALLVGLMLASLSLDTGLGADDHIHALILKGSDRIEGFGRHRLDLFRFASGDEANNRLLMREGVFPWWADPEVKLAFWRPLTSLGHWLDYRLWPETPALMHLHSLAWYALSLLAVWALYRRLTPAAWIAVLALLLYVVDDARGAPVAWVANRHALVSAALALWALMAHLRWRQDGWSFGAWLGPTLWAAALLAGESAVGVLAYLGAFALCLDRGPLWRRVGLLWPFGVALVGWRFVYRGLDYGASGSAMYVDPLQAPLDFLAALAERGPPLLLSQLALPWSEWWMGYPLVASWLPHVVTGIALLVIAATAVAIAPLWRSEARVRFWCVGALLALVPICTTFPSDRMLIFVAIGAMGVVAELFAWLCDSLATWGGGRARVAKGLLHAIVAIHLVISPLLYPLRARGIVAVREALARANDSLPKDPSVQDQIFVLVNPPTDAFASYIPIVRASVGEPMPQTQVWLSAGTSPVTVQRLGERSLRVRPADGFLQNSGEWMLRARERPMHVGEVVDLGHVRVRVEALTADGRPAEASFEFDRDLEDASLRWFQWRGLGFVPFTPPGIGHQQDLEQVDLISASLGTE